MKVKQLAFATRLPEDLIQLLDDVCQRTGLRKNHILETALREKLEDLLDAEDLKAAQQEASGFHRWEDVWKEARTKSS